MSLTWPIMAGGVLLGVAIGAGGMYTRVTALKVDIAELKQTQAEDVSKQYEAWADDINAAAANVSTAAKSGALNVIAINTKLDIIAKNYKNAKPAPLPVDCRPGAVRVRNLAESAAAVDAAIARPVTGR